MLKLTVNDAAEKLGISKEAVYNRIRRNTIQTINENGVKYVVLEDTNPTNTPSITKEKNIKKQSIAENDDFIKYLLQEVEDLKNQNKILQNDKEKLYQEKEEILVSSKEEIKTMYKERDEKLQYFLSLFEKPLLGKTTEKEEEPFEIIINEPQRNWLSLGEYISKFEFKKKKRIKIKKLLVKSIGKSEFIKIDSGILYIREDINLKELKEKL